MFLVSVLRNALLILLPLSFLASSYLYLYPLFDISCAFPTPERDAKLAHRDTFLQHIPFSSKLPDKRAPFRLLSLGDPQLEGDSSIPDTEALNFPNFYKFWKDALLLDGTRLSALQRLRFSLHDLIDFYLDDIPRAFNTYRKRLDHVGNDYYLGHIYRTLHWWTKPTHVTVLGDLVGSQWIDDEEFDSRGWRYWNRVFKGGLKVPDEVAAAPSAEYNQTITLGNDAELWKSRIINVAGNHDIGYAGDLSHSRIRRFTRVFGKPNYELRFRLPVGNSSVALDSGLNEEDGGDKPTPELRIVVLNDMNLDTPAGSSELQGETYEFLNDVITTSKGVSRTAHFTLVLTHIPLYKDAGICVDGPFFDFFTGEFENGVKEQNHLSRDASKGFLEGVFGMSGNPEVEGFGFGRHGLIMNGHDHEGCDIYHYINQTVTEEKIWQVQRYEQALAAKIDQEPAIPGLREITVRSMMGDFAGNAGFLSLWFDEEKWDWQFEFSQCRLGKQHFWWFVHVLDLVTLCILILYILTVVVKKARNVIVAEFKRRFSKKPKRRKTISKADVKDAAPNLSVINSSGRLDVPGAGKKSLRKKRSKNNVNGSASSTVVGSS